MSDLQSKQVNTRKHHRCEWCDELIRVGSKAQYRAYIFDGEFISSWQHPECFESMGISDPLVLADGWMAGDNERGVPA
jgi:hypothetical protein